MQITFVYKGVALSATGIFHNLPHTGDFLKVNGCIFKIEAVMFCQGAGTFNNMSAVIYLTDIMPETEKKLKYC